MTVCQLTETVANDAFDVLREKTNAGKLGLAKGVTCAVFF